MRCIDEHDILLNCLNWQRDHLKVALSVIAGVEKYPSLRERQQQITQQMQAALQGVEQLMGEVQARSTERETPIEDV